MTSISLKILKVLLLVDVLLLIVSIAFGGKLWIYNTQIGFISATLIMIASVISYRRMVNTRVEHGIVTMDDSKDVIEKLEDPYDLYSEEVVEEKTEEDLVEVVKEERKKLLSIYRLGAYAVLILGFLYLNRHELLHIPSYLLALSLPPMIIVIMLVTQKENHSQD
jgi:hypothetical protein